MNYTRPPLAIQVKTIKKAFSDAKRRNVRLRYLTEITKDNISYCKELMTIVDELRHLDGIKGNFMLSETEYLSPVVLFEKEKVASQIIYSNVKEIVEHQLYVFDTFWSRSILAQQKIREIEEGIEAEFYEVITDRKKAAQILFELAKSIKKEALILLPNDKSMIRLNRLGVIDYTIKASQEKDAEVKIICPLSEVNSEIVKRISSSAPNIKILNGNNSLYGMYIVDSEKFLRAELKEPNAETLSESIGFTFYSNSKLSVDSYKSIFELLWNEHMLNEELRRVGKIEREFITVAAHELRNPIQPILALTEVLRSIIKEPEQQELLDVTIRNAKRLQHLAEDILDVTKIERQSLNLKYESFNLNDIITNAIDDLTINIASSKKSQQGNVIKLAYQPQVIFIEADKARITQVISNLLNNAVKFTEVKVNEGEGEGEGRAIININTEKVDDVQAIVSIRDTGTGIDPEILPRLFEKFATKSYQGTGLGLFISKGIIQAHGGKIWAENNRDNKDGKRGGATFRFSLPISKENSSIIRKNSGVNQLVTKE
jgi:signal transduction histidine kinase